MSCGQFMWLSCDTNLDMMAQMVRMQAEGSRWHESSSKATGKSGGFSIYECSDSQPTFILGSIYQVHSRAVIEKAQGTAIRFLEHRHR